MSDDGRIGIDGSWLGIYDGVIAWLNADGTVTNRFEGYTLDGYYDRVEAWLDEAFPDRTWDPSELTGGWEDEV